MKKVYYSLYLVTEESEEFLAKVKSKGLAIRTKMLYNKIYEGKGKIIIKQRILIPLAQAIE